MSMLLSFWFFAFRRKNDTVAAELCGRKAWAAVVSGIRRDAPRLRPEIVPGRGAGANDRDESPGKKVGDSTAFSLCKDNDLSILVFDLTDPENIVKAVSGEAIGTLVQN